MCVVTQEWQFSSKLAIVKSPDAYSVISDSNDAIV